MKILLIHFRKNNKTIEHEKKCFIKFVKNQKEIDFINIFEQKSIFNNPYYIFRKYTHIILGGSSEFSLTKEAALPKERDFIIKKTEKIIKEILKKDFPTLGVCFGHQLIARHLGIKILRHLKKKEIGTFLVYKNKDDQLLKNIPSKFYAIFAHIDFVSNRKIKHLQILAKTNKDNNTILKFKNNVYGIQFHAELSKKDFLERLKITNEREYLNFFPNLKNTKESENIIKNFLKIKT
ncbi:MAG: gamma-glutamyl-gamma-aminobutyrate hydrolase family protein [Candidatus Anstonellales archaeon]